MKKLWLCLIALLSIGQISAQQIFTKSIPTKHLEPSLICVIFGQPSLHSSANSVFIQRAPNFNPISLPEGVIACIGLDNLSTIVVQSTSEEAIRKMEQLIALFDVAPKQIEITAKLMTLSSVNMKKMNLNWQKSFFATDLAGSLGPDVKEGLEFRLAKGDALVALKALGSQNNAKTLNQQSIVVLNSIPGFISFSQQIPVWMNGSISVWRDGYTIQPPVLAFASIVTALNVQANVVGGDIELLISPQVQEVLGYTQGYGGQRVPMTSLFNLYTRVRVKNNEELIIGGLTRNGDKTGWFNQVKENTESLLIVSARIIPE